MAKKWKGSNVSGGSGGGVYFLGFIGAAVYYLHVSTGVWPSIIALLKACVWPAFVVYHLLSH